MRVAIIPARGGSKRIPRKNIKEFFGRPMIAYSIDAAIKSECFDRIIVSTDDAEIAEIAKSLGAEVPFMRPENLSGDYVATVPVIKHAIEELEKSGKIVDLACCIYATAPFLDKYNIAKGLEYIKNIDICYSFSVTTYAYPVQRALRLNQSGQIGMLNPDEWLTRSQDLEEIYHDAGQFYWGKRDSWLKELSILSSPAVPIVLPRIQVQDIDTPEDWGYAEAIFEVLKKQEDNA